MKFRISVISQIAPVFFLFLMLFLFPFTAQGQGFGAMFSPGELAAPHKNMEGLTDCTDCHTLGGGISNDKCMACHKKLTKRIKAGKGYHGNLKKKCIACHADHKGRDYKMIRLDVNSFSHKKAGYLLEAKHKTGCEKCHKKKGTYLGLSQTCTSCHDDVHKNKLGGDCLSCHYFSGWKSLLFVHNRDSRYKLEGKHEKVPCEKCHSDKTFKLSSKFDLCQTCHVKDDKHKGKLGDNCKKCHTTLSWKKIIIDHSKTKYPLRGKHAQVICQKCHVQGKTSIKAYSTCSESGCHKDPHKKQFKDATCESCHTESGWKPSRFSHEMKEYKGYRLTGNHEKVQCEKCHVAGAYKPIVYSRCDTSGCHSDPHKEQFKDATCESCHTEAGWKPSGFSHSKKEYEGYRLLEKHEEVKCEKCHVAGRYKPIEYSRCDTSGCHSDPHKEQFKDATCESCHTEAGWKLNPFSHSRKEYKGYRLKGKHEEVKCEKCHEAGRYKPIEYSSCDASACHEDPHKKQFDDATCESCHNENGWKPSGFLHSKKEYKGYRLRGKHEEVKCEKCHQSGLYKPIEYFTCDSSGCHKDTHKGEFKKTCRSCHREVGWKRIVFDHEDSSYPLTGKHKDAKCEKCHSDGKYKMQDKTCVSCHKDKHDGELGRDCDRCHTTYNWRPKSYTHEKTGFQLKFVHRQLECQDCHNKSGNSFQGVDSRCFSCHRDPHFNQFGEFCSDCHDASEWFPRKFDHNATGMQLRGVHRLADCKDCHENREYRNIVAPDDCYGCHTGTFNQATNHLSGSYSTTCTECHTTFLAWTFSHSSATNCNDCHSANYASASGHVSNGYSTDCVQCHSSRSTWTFNHSIGADCNSCHSSNYASAPNHVSSSYSTDCTGCHRSTQVWSFSHGSVAGNCSDCHLSDRPSAHVSSNWSVCEECHNATSSWSFSHPSTSFPLNHEGTNRNDCASCHPSSNYTNSGGCILCHQREGEKVHETNNNSQCLSCHPAGDE